MFLTITKKHILISITIILLIISTTFCISLLADSKSNTNWGLSFKKHGESPVGNATPQFLKEFNSYYIGDTTIKKIYITFDAGYENGYTPDILDALKKHNAKATFFVVSTFMKSSPDLIKRMVSEGHIIGNHTMTHPNMSKMSTIEDFKKEILPVETMYKEITGQDMQKFYRPPQGIYNLQNLQMANELGYKTIFWSLAYVDWYVDKQPTKDAAFKKLLPRIHPGAILLLHSTSKTNSEILDELLTKLEKEGYTFGILNELVK
ncbi:MAG: polysaccharide deacetylase family protein [Clostridia bacterium]